MRPIPSSVIRLLLCLSLLSLNLFTSPTLGQQLAPPVQPRITRAIDDAQLTTLRGNTHPLAVAKFDRGAALPTMPLERMLLVLKRSPEQVAALINLLDQQQDKSSPNYHKWLTPEQFGKQFGPADADIQAVTGWLQTHGFQIAQVSKGRTVIEFSGTASMVQDAFHTQIHRYLVDGVPHWANASDPQIPNALLPVVAGVWTMHDFLKKPMLRMSEQHFPLIHPPGSARPYATSPNGNHFLSPGDFAVIYGINPVYQAGTKGSGVVIAVLGRSDLPVQDVFDFRNVFSMPQPDVLTIQNGPDPGNLGGGEEAEAVLDATWSGAIAPNSTVEFIVSASTNTTDGVDLSEIYAIDNNLGDVLTESFGSCEANASSSEIAGLSSLAEQAAAQGITYVVSSGDTGSAGCDNLSETTATGPVSINVLASTPFNVAVGGTQFNENGRPSTYWSANTAAAVTALKYIPENVWNESCTSASCGSNANIAAGGGGPSSVVPKPNWQSGSNLHIPPDGFRDVPDVSLTAAGHDPYLICLAGSCSQQGFLAGISGTSASAPSFAGVIALVIEKLRTASQNPSARIGLANYTLYGLANSETLSQCNASSTSTSPAATCVFNDVTTGNNAVPGEASYGGSSPQFPAALGYDLANGLGSVQVNNLVDAWAAATFGSTSTTLRLTPSPTNVMHGTPVQVDITVTPGNGSTVPTGDVSLIQVPSPGHSQGVAVFHLANGNTTGVTNALPGGMFYDLHAHYSGDSNFAPSDSPAVQVTVSAESSTTKVTVLTADANGNPIPFTSGPYGSFIYLRADVAGNSGFGTPTGGMSFFDFGAYLAGSGLNSQGNTHVAPSGNSALTAGSHSITATYLGDASFQPSNPSPAVNFTVTKAATTTSVQSNPSTAAPIGSAVTLTATVDTNSKGFPPIGNIVFFNGGTQVSGTVALSYANNPQTGYVQSIGTLLTNALPSGQNSITAQYNADTNYSGSTSSAITLTVAPSYALAFTGSTGSVMAISSPGRSGSLTLNVAGQVGYTGTVKFSTTACSGLPLNATCSFNPPTVTGSGTTTLSVMTLAPHSVFPQTGTAGNFWFSTSGFTLAAVFVVGISPCRRRWAYLLGPLLLLSLLTLAGCSGGGGGGATQTPGTPRGSFPVTITGDDGTFKNTVIFTLTIQ